MDGYHQLTDIENSRADMLIENDKELDQVDYGGATFSQGLETVDSKQPASTSQLSYKVSDDSNINSKYADGRKRKKRKAIKTSIFARRAKDKDS